MTMDASQDWKSHKAVFWLLMFPFDIIKKVTICDLRDEINIISYHLLFYNPDLKSSYLDERFREIRLKCCAHKIAKSHDEIHSRILEWRDTDSSNI